MSKLLLIVDPQIDFISGSLPVEDAANRMDALAAYISRHNDYAAKIVTTDWHPFNHCSFKENGGEWPMHCVQNTVGAALYPALVAPLNTTAGPLYVLRKGNSADREEYSIFGNAESAARIDQLVRDLHIDHIDLCGIAGDVCVLNTLQDGVARYGAGLFHVLEPYVASLDGGTKLREAIGKLQVK